MRYKRLPVSNDTRSRILDRALALFVARGYDGVGIQEIVDAAKVTKPTLYHYFGSKAGLLSALFDERLEELHERLAVAARYERHLPTTLEAIAQVFFSFATEHPDLYRMHLAMWFAPAESEARKAIARAHERQFSLLENLFIQATPDYGNMRGRHRAYAATFLGMVNSYVALALNGHTRLDDALRRQAIHQFVHGIFS
ncbi:MAG: TetR/AcrR family transcriptional regulator [Deltaproteobacteria bacterium]|nr:TetR/AcrR family transcriptional regulator [Deltaproteobacteria bacterium]